MKVQRLACGIGLVGLLVVPGIVRAQSATTGAIAGTVKDATGAVLPGVTVEAASPALIEKVRIAVTDNRGEYKIVDLRSGTYTVAFTLTGFSTFKREGIELTTGFTANVDAEMKIGSLEETVTVTGASPVVDIQNTRQQTVLSRRDIDTLPTGKSIAAFAALTLGATNLTAQQDVGGDKGEGAAAWGIHGASSNDSRMLFDGMHVASFGSGGPSGRNYQINQMAIQEVTVATRGISAEAEVGGPLINQVPKDGGNTFHLSIIGNGAGPGLQNKSVPDNLVARGLSSAPSIKKLYDVGVGFGGPLKRDKLWFYQADRWWGAQNYVPGNYFADKSTPAARGGLIYIPDLSKPAFLDSPNADWSGRLTWQASSKQKIAGYVSYQHDCNCYFQADNNKAPEATPLINYRPVLGQATWNYTATARLLFEAGFSGIYGNDYNTYPPNTGPDAISVFDLSRGYQYNAPGNTTNQLGPSNFNVYGTFYNHIFSERFSMTYVTGSHALKAGFNMLEAQQDYTYQANPIVYHFRLGVPAAVQQWASPQAYKSWVRPDLGIYAQDQWTIKKLTLNLGVRFDYVNGSTPAAQLGAGPFVPARSFPAARNVPNFKDLSPRIGAAYDVFGDGKTAFKASLGRYVQAQTFALLNANLPAYRIATNATRTWSDVNGDLAPNCDLTNPLTNGECGTLNNLNFGKVIPVTTFADDALTGWGRRGYMWQTDATIQHELRPNLALMAGYYRTWYGNNTVTDNLAVTPANFDPYCITAPVDARLPSGGGYQICGLYDLNPSRFGQVNNVVTQDSNFGKRTEVYNGFDVALRARFGEGGLIQGGMATGQTSYDACFVVDTPMALEPGTQNRLLPASQCKTKLPFEGQTQYKAAVIYPFPWYGIQVSGTFQNLAGIPIQAQYVVPNALIAPSLGRNLAAGVNGTAVVDLMEPNTRFEDRLSQLDLRFTKIVRVGRARLQGSFDIYNVANTRTILRENLTYGPNWLRPIVILGGRLMKFGGQIDF